MKSEPKRPSIVFSVVPSFMKEVREAPKHQVICPRSHSRGQRPSASNSNAISSQPHCSLFIRSHLGSAGTKQATNLWMY